MDPVIWAAIITVCGLAIPVTVGLITNSVNNRHAIDAQFRKDKADMFLKFVEAFDGVFYGQQSTKRSQDSLFKNLLKTRRELIVWCSVETIAKFDEMKEFATDPEYSPGSVGHMFRIMQLYSEFLLALRRDLGLSCKGLDGRTFALRLMLQNPELAIQEFEKNPEMSIDDLATLEKRLGNGT